MSTQHQPTLRVLSVLELISTNNQDYTLSDLSRSLDIPTSTLSPILHTLREERYLALHESTRTYSLGTRLFEIGSRVQNSITYKKISAILKNVTVACGETCHFAVLDGGDVFFLATVDSPQPIRMHCATGRRIPAYGTAVGKALLRNRSLEELKQLYPEGLRPLTAHTTTDFDQLYAKVNNNDVFLYESEESTESVCCIAVPIYQRGTVVAASSVATPIFRYDEEKKAAIEHALRDARIEFEKIAHLFTF